MKLISVTSRGNRLAKIYGGITAKKTLVWSVLCKQFEKGRFQIVVNRERKLESTAFKAASEWLEGAQV